MALRKVAKFWKAQSEVRSGEFWREELRPISSMNDIHKAVLKPPIFPNKECVSGEIKRRSSEEVATVDKQDNWKITTEMWQTEQYYFLALKLLDLSDFLKLPLRGCLNLISVKTNVAQKFAIGKNVTYSVSIKNATTVQGAQWNNRWTLKPLALASCPLTASAQDWNIFIDTTNEMEGSGGFKTRKH